LQPTWDRQVTWDLLPVDVPAKNVEIFQREGK
jgi:hypothetical protein